MKRIVKAIILIAIGMQVNSLRAKEIKDFDYYANELYTKGCVVLKEWEKEPNYKDMLKLKKVENTKTAILAKIVMMNCGAKGQYQKEIEGIKKDKEILVLANKLVDLSGYNILKTSYYNVPIMRVSYVYEDVEDFFETWEGSAEEKEILEYLDKVRREEKNKDFEYYLEEISRKGCPVILEWQEESNYKEILKMTKEYELGRGKISKINIGTTVVARCGVETLDKEEYKWEILANDKELLLLKNKIFKIIDYVRSPTDYITDIYSVAGFFARYYPGWETEDEEVLNMREENIRAIRLYDKCAWIDSEEEEFIGEEESSIGEEEDYDKIEEECIKKYEGKGLGEDNNFFIEEDESKTVRELIWERDRKQAEARIVEYKKATIKAEAKEKEDKEILKAIGLLVGGVIVIAGVTIVIRKTIRRNKKR